MPEPTVALFYGDPYRCEQALAARDAAIGAGGAAERIVRFGDELDTKALGIELSSGSLFSPRRHFLLRHTEAISPIRTIYPIIDRPRPMGTYLTLIAATGKGLDTLIKKIRRIGKVQGFPPPRGRNLHRAATAILERHGVQITSDEAATLVTRGGGDLLFLDAEARKLATYGHPLTPEALSALSYSGGEESVYPLIDRIGERNLRGALAALSRLHIDPSRVFSVLLYHLTRLLSVRILTGLGPDKIASLIGTPAWLARRLRAQAQNYTKEELTAALACGIKLDQAIKRGGIRPGDAVLKLILKTMNPSASPAPGYAQQTRLSR